MTDVAPLPRWTGTPALLGTVWTLHKGSRSATCEVWSHPLGWELRLSTDAEFVRSEVCRSLVGYLDVADGWKIAFTEKGWAG
jgi:hypothetical protein